MAEYYPYGTPSYYPTYAPRYEVPTYRPAAAEVAPIAGVPAAGAMVSGKVEDVTQIVGAVTTCVAESISFILRLLMCPFTFFSTLASMVMKIVEESMGAITGALPAPT